MTYDWYPPEKPDGLWTAEFETWNLEAAECTWSTPEKPHFYWGCERQARISTGVKWSVKLEGYCAGPLDEAKRMAERAQLTLMTFVLDNHLDDSDLNQGCSKED